MTSGLFAEWQPLYAERGIATFPVRNKRPAVKGYLQAGIRASQTFARQFPNEVAFGLACRKNRVTVVDIDSPDERLLVDALDDFGPTPFVVRSGSGNYQAWYRHNGERRRIRPDHRPIDILGDGFVVAPPSIGAKGNYTILTGSLDDLASLPTMRGDSVCLAGAKADRAYLPPARVEEGRRNSSLWQSCMRTAPQCGTFSELLETARQRNSEANCDPLPDLEVRQIAESAWSYETAGKNRFGCKRVVCEVTEIDVLLRRNPDAFLLLIVLRRHHYGGGFFVSNGMASTMSDRGWTRKRFAAARAYLVLSGVLQEVRPASREWGPALYRFKGGQF